jgi:hypothetical protein
MTSLKWFAAAAALLAICLLLLAVVAVSPSNKPDDAAKVAGGTGTHEPAQAAGSKRRNADSSSPLRSEAAASRDADRTSGTAESQQPGADQQGERASRSTTRTPGGEADQRGSGSAEEDRIEARIRAGDWQGAPEVEFASRELPMERQDIRGDRPVHPEPLYVDQRVTFRHIALGQWRGMLVIYGSLWTDFPRDPSRGGGSLLGLRLAVSLARSEAPLESDAKSGLPTMPRQFGDSMTDVPGARVETTVQVQEDRLGRADFRLPVFRLPLPPGVYRLRAELSFSAQSDPVREALKQCPDLYGGETTFVDGSWEVEDVYTNPKLRDKYHEQLFTVIRAIHDDATVLLGNLLDGDELVLRGHGSGEAANLAIRDRMVQQLEWVRDLQAQRAELIARDGPGADTASIDALIARYGGGLLAEESRYLGLLDREAAAVMHAIREFEDRLRLRYWILLDGWLTYPGWHTLNRTCYHAWNAIAQNDVAAAERERRENLDKAKAAPGGLEARWESRQEAWKYQPREIRDVAFAYLKAKEETTAFDPRKLTMKDAGKLSLDLAAIRDVRARLIEKWLPEAEKQLANLQTSQYCVQVWPGALRDAREAMRQVMRLAWSWEYHIRTDKQAEDPAAVRTDWAAEVTGWTGINVADFTANADAAPGTVKSAFDAARLKADTAVGLPGMRYRWRVAIDAEQVPPGR